ncbi:hypothetical protein RJ641_006501 [Dillenia turbinata]|uniref:Uncharacterized protein n=1 Tax=Dillenia turbinata TaxID=194707 RepID=A0AAN8V5I0_9MAGN
MRIDIVKWGLCFLILMFFQGWATFFESSLAALRSSNSAWTSSTPPILRSIPRALSGLPLTIMELGVSGRMNAENAIKMAGTPAPPKLMRHPQPPFIRAKFDKYPTISNFK